MGRCLGRCWLVSAVFCSDIGETLDVLTLRYSKLHVRSNELHMACEERCERI